MRHNELNASPDKIVVRCIGIFKDIMKPCNLFRWPPRDIMSNPECVIRKQTPVRTFQLPVFLSCVFGYFLG
jgi:hypothetical protein